MQGAEEGRTGNTLGLGHFLSELRGIIADAFSAHPIAFGIVPECFLVARTIVHRAAQRKVDWRDVAIVDGDRQGSLHAGDVVVRKDLALDACQPPPGLTEPVVQPGYLAIGVNCLVHLARSAQCVTVSQPSAQRLGIFDDQFMFDRQRLCVAAHSVHQIGMQPAQFLVAPLIDQTRCISLGHLEPILLEHAASLPGVTLLNRTQVTAFEQDENGVTATAINLDTGTTQTIRSRYMVGCDGGRSGVRKQMGAQFEGTAIIQRVQSTYIHAPQLMSMIPGQRAWSTYVMNPNRCGTVFSIDGHDNWLIHNHLSPDEPDFDSVDRDWSIRQILGVGPDFNYEVLSKEDWVGRRLVSNRFRNGKVFLAGDSAHIWMPYAGYGMNAGIADALNLSWLLAARVQGWGAEAILNAYEAERQPITEQVSQFAMNHAQQMIKMKRGVPHNIEAEGEEGDAVRADMGRAAYELNVQQFCAGGLNFGYFYSGSPIIAHDSEVGAETAPAYTMGDFTPSTVPGCRAPHFWLDEARKRSLYDAFGPGYTLVRFEAGVEVGALLSAAALRNMPLTVVDVPAGLDIPSAYGHKLVLCRTDQHVVWRGDLLPASVDELVSQLCGFATA